jgi:PEP-CTERM motif
MKTLICTLMLATLTAAAANADVVTIALDQPDQSGSQGDTLQFFGTITNDSADTIFLNSDSFTLGGLSLTFEDQFQNTPLSLAPQGQAGDSSGDIELFDVAVNDPLVDPTGKYLGSYTLIGGADGGDGTGADVLGTATFSVTTVPEPSTIYLLLAACVVAGSAALFSRRNRARASGAA